MTTTTGETEPQVPAAKKNVFARIAGVLFAPAQTFEDIARRPDYVAPLLIIVILGYLCTAVIAPRFDFEAFTAEQSARMRQKNPSLSAADAERFGRMGAATSKMFLWTFPVLGIVIYAVVAGVFLFAFRMMGGEGTFGQAFSVTLYSWIPFVIGGLIMAVVVLARGSFDPTTAATLVKSNPAFLTDMKEQPVLFSLFSSLDLFSFWMLVLLVFGFSAMSTLSKKTSAVIVVVVWLGYVLTKTGLTALFA